MVGKESVAKLLKGDPLIKALEQCTLEKVTKKAAVLLSNKLQLFKLTAVKARLTLGKELDVAASLLHEAGLFSVILWKKPGSTGYPATCLATGVVADDPILRMELQNVFRKFLV